MENFGIEKLGSLFLKKNQINLLVLFMLSSFPEEGGPPPPPPLPHIHTQPNGILCTLYCAKNIFHTNHFVHSLQVIKQMFPIYMFWMTRFWSKASQYVTHPFVIIVILVTFFETFKSPDPWIFFWSIDKAKTLKMLWKFWEEPKGF